MGDYFLCYSTFFSFCNIMSFIEIIHLVKNLLTMTPSNKKTNNNPKVTPKLLKQIKKYIVIIYHLRHFLNQFDDRNPLESLWIFSFLSFLAICSLPPSLLHHHLLPFHPH